MSDDWVQYTVRDGDNDLHTIMVRYGYFPAGAFPSDPFAEDHKPDVLVSKTWYSDKNPQFKTAGRVFDKVVTGEKVFLPPKDVPGNMVARQYVANGVEGTLNAVIDWIKTNHGTGAACLEPSAVPLDQLTPDYLYNLQQNIPFAENHPGGAGAGLIPISKGNGADKGPDVITYFVTLRPSANRDAAAGPSGSASSNSMVSGPSPFTITVAIADSMSPPETQVLPVINHAGATPDNEGNELDVNGNFRDPKASFTVGITKTGTQDPYRTTFRIYTGDRNLVFEEAHTDGTWIQPGSNTWTWDGFNSADDTKAVLDTRVLRGKLILQVTVEPQQGVAAVHEFFMNNRAPKGEWADIKVNLATRVVDVEAFVHFERITDDPVLMALITGAVVIGFGAVAGLAMLGEYIGAENAKGWNHKQKKSNEKEMWAVTGGVAAGAAAITETATLLATRLNDDELADAIATLKAGLEQYWTRTGTRAISIGNTTYEIHTTCTNRSDNAIKMSIMKPLKSGQRGVNLGMVLPGCPVIVTYLPADKPFMKYTGAHEFGHSVLADDMSKDWSIRHKNTTGGATNQAALPTAPHYADNPPPQDIDLMKYYQYEATPYGYYTRMSAVQSDALRLFRTTRVEWREDKDNAATDSTRDASGTPANSPSPGGANPPSPSPSPSPTPSPSPPAT